LGVPAPLHLSKNENEKKNPAQVGQLTGHAGHAQLSWSSMAQAQEKNKKKSDDDDDDDDVISLGGRPGPRFSRNRGIKLVWAHSHSHRHLMDCHASATLR